LLGLAFDLGAAVLDTRDGAPQCQQSHVEGGYSGAPSSNAAVDGLADFPPAVS
jgi:hypothetical protein